MSNPLPNLDGITLVAVKDGVPVKRQAEIVAAFLRPAIAAGVEACTAYNEEVTLKAPDSARRLQDLELECATLRHSLRLADRRYEELVAARTTPGPAATKRQKSIGILVLDAARGVSGVVESLTVIDGNAAGQPMVKLVSTQSASTAPLDATESVQEAGLRTAVQSIAQMLADREWSEHISKDPDAVALETAITGLIGQLSAVRDGATVSETGMPASQEPKYGIRGGCLYNRASNTPIPKDEPIFIFRARDRKALSALHFYAGVCDNPEHVAAVQQRIMDFQAFGRHNPTRMKQPDTDLSVLDAENRLQESQ
ncbi:hypothetical protein [Noviherbaspirillum suwonense]|uniref:Uncharacterized protein n=1 Tax=Noviherbaspirillum suwonense TaxID=1224511 RepID=A0ABY1QUA7_9BURK|nr:hypothetical protein [Noviherbaspirillum suwonense]SMP80305.1 hypothetical protein SAMN06295970_13511 [Noviherbaspirillum suwonense]